MARVIFNGEPNDVWVNETGKIQYQFIVQWRNSCGLCAQYDHAIGPSWPIPLHYGCRCQQVLIRVGAEADPFVDFREKIRELDLHQQAVVVGKSNLQLIEAGTVKWEDVVTRSRVRLLREVVSREKLSIKAMRDAGVKEYIAIEAHATVTTPAHQLADQQRRELVARLAVHGMSEEQAKREFGERLAKRLSIEEGPSGKQAFRMPPTPNPKPLVFIPQPELQRKAATAETIPKKNGPDLPEWKEAKSLDEAKEWGKQYNIEVEPSSPQPVTLEHLNATLKEFAKAPMAVLNEIKKAGLKARLLVGKGITDHPIAAHLKNVTPRGWEGSHKTWDDVPGLGGSETVIVVNRLREGHGSKNLVLHEHAHTYQRSQSILKGQDPTTSKEWLEVHKSNSWPNSYERTYPEEGFAESFAKYFNSEGTRATLPEGVKSYWEARVSEWSKQK